VPAPAAAAEPTRSEREFLDGLTPEERQGFDTLNDQMKQMVLKRVRAQTSPDDDALTKKFLRERSVPCDEQNAGQPNAGQQAFLDGLTPDERKQWDSLRTLKQREILAGIEADGFDEERRAAALAEMWSAYVPPAVPARAPAPDPPARASVADWIRALSGRADRLMMTTQALKQEIGDHHESWRFLEGLLNEVVRRARDPDSLIDPLTRTLKYQDLARARGKPIRKLAAYFTRCVKNYRPPENSGGPAP
jgi:hypothetical protein